MRLLQIAPQAALHVVTLDTSWITSASEHGDSQGQGGALHLSSERRHTLGRRRVRGKREATPERRESYASRREKVQIARSGAKRGQTEGAMDWGLMG